MDDWPDRRDNDIGWAYASMASDDLSEGVTVVVCNDDGEALIREVQWGRP